MCPKTASTCKVKTKEAILAGSSARKDFFAISATLQWNAFTTLTSIREFIVIAPDATKVKFVHFFTRSRNVTMRRKFARIIENRSRTKSIIST
jgi:hypothetical protein